MQNRVVKRANKRKTGKPKAAENPLRAKCAPSNTERFNSLNSRRTCAENEQRTNMHFLFGSLYSDTLIILRCAHKIPKTFILVHLHNASGKEFHNKKHQNTVKNDFHFEYRKTNDIFFIICNKYAIDS